MWQVTGSGLCTCTVLNGLDGFAQAANNMRESGNTLGDGFGGEQVIASFVSSTAFSCFTPGDFQVLRQFLAETPAKAFLHIGADGIQAADLLLAQLASTIVPAQNFRVAPKIFEKPAGKLIDTKRLKPICVRRFG